MNERFENVRVSRDRLDIVSIEEDEIVATGTLVWSETMKPFAEESAVELRTLYVDPTCKGEGIGTALLDSLSPSVARLLPEISDFW